MSKKIAVIVRDRQAEALRMTVGLTLMDDAIDVFVLNRKLDMSEENALNIETIHEMEISVYSNHEDGDGIKRLPEMEFSERLLTYDHILPY